MTATWFRLSGLAVLVGAVLGFLGSLGTGFFYGNTVNYAHNPVFIISNVVNALGAFLVVVGLPGVLARQAEGFATLGVIGLVLIIMTAISLPIFLGILGALVVPWLA